MKLVYQSVEYDFRSRDFMLWLALIKNAYPNWVSYGDILNILPRVSPRQIARFVDLLEAENLQIVQYETKTRGRFRLSVDANLLDMPQMQTQTLQLERQAKADKVGHAPNKMVELPLDAYMNPDWEIWVLSLLHAQLALLDGHLTDKKGCLSYLATAEQATASLPQWTKSIVYARFAHALGRVSDYQAAWQYLRKVDTLVKQDLAHPDIEARSIMIKAKIRYDQARYEDAEDILATKIVSRPLFSPYHLNLQALLWGRKSLSDFENSRDLLTRALQNLFYAMGSALLWVEDSTFLDVVTYNISNQLLRAADLKHLNAQAANGALRWLSLNMIVCRKFGLGEDSVLSDLLLFDIGHGYGFSKQGWHPLLSQASMPFCSLEKILDRATIHAQHTGNALENYECLHRRLLIGKKEQISEEFRLVEKLLKKTKRLDLLDQLKSQWLNRFGEYAPSG